jgi:hypothetical protein
VAKEPKRLGEDEYESPTLGYYKETNAMVPLVRIGLYIPPRM